MRLCDSVIIVSVQKVVLSKQGIHTTPEHLLFYYSCFRIITERLTKHKSDLMEMDTSQEVTTPTSVTPNENSPLPSEPPSLQSGPPPLISIFDEMY